MKLPTLIAGSAVGLPVKCNLDRRFVFMSSRLKTAP